MLVVGARRGVEKVREGVGVVEGMASGGHAGGVGLGYSLHPANVAPVTVHPSATSSTCLCRPYAGELLNSKRACLVSQLPKLICLSAEVVNSTHEVKWVDFWFM